MTVTNIEELNNALNDPAEFRRLIEDQYDLTTAAKAFPNHAEALIQIVLNDPAEFKRLIKDQHDLTTTAKALPNHAEALIQIVLYEPAEFKRLIKNQYDLAITAELFPNHTEIFKQPTVENALKAIVQQSNIANQAYTLGAVVGALANIIPPLPREIRRHIGLFLDRKRGGCVAQTSKKAAKEATDEKKKMQTKQKLCM